MAKSTLRAYLGKFEVYETQNRLEQTNIQLTLRHGDASLLSSRI
jgi:hypothetical protein